MTNEHSGHFIQSAGSAPAVSSIDVTVLYDPRDGRVVHMHQSSRWKERSEKATPRNGKEQGKRLAPWPRCRRSRTTPCSGLSAHRQDVPSGPSNPGACRNTRPTTEAVAPHKDRRSGL
jgi:hypothetical protein